MDATCLNCGNTFIYKVNRRRKFCSLSCYRHYPEKVKKERKLAERGNTRTKRCLNCSTGFSYEIGRGRDKKYCSIKCRNDYEERSRVHRRQIRGKICSTPDCGKLVSRPSYGLCEACYYQLRRTGGVARRGVTLRVITKEGYVRLILPFHPLATTRGCILEHRKILFDQHGTGPHPCFWCGTSLDWKEIVGDHLNEIKHDNRPENLVISCNTCNRMRGGMLGLIRRIRPEVFPVFVECARNQISEKAILLKEMQPSV
jgi:hypothetical protein